MGNLILVVNPGSTSTKFAIFNDENLVFEQSVSHSSDDLKGFTKIAEQFNFRKEIIVSELISRGVNLEDISAIVIPNCDPHNSEYLADHWKKTPLRYTFYL